jgi:predicted metal-dependent phosphoesterase TrpH
MRQKLKVDFHTHTSDDPKDYINFSSHELINRAAQLGFDGLAITNHDVVTFSKDLEGYAQERGVCLIPGVELTLSKKHILLLNPNPDDVPSLHKLEDLEKIRNAANLVIAPHPFFPGFKCLGKKLEIHLPLFDAIEYSFFYNHLINRNKKALRLAASRNKPLVGDSDCHNIWQIGTTYTLVEAEKNIASIVAAVKEGRTEVVTTPLPVVTMARVAVNFALGDRLKIHLKI